MRTGGRTMTEAGAKDTPQCRYNEEARAKLKGHIERAAARRRDRYEVNWDELWNKIELAARAYYWSMESPSIKAYSPRDTIKGLAGCGKLIDALIRKLKTPALWNWNFVSDSTDPWCRSIKSESPKSLGGLIEQLTAARDKATADAAELRTFAAGQKIRAYRQDDCLIELKGRILGIGQDYLGRQVGSSDGPLITFLGLALEPILGAATPDGEALRAFARERQQGRKRRHRRRR
jgi:hypothetical protein